MPCYLYQNILKKDSCTEKFLSLHFLLKFMIISIPLFPPNTGALFPSLCLNLVTKLTNVIHSTGLGVEKSIFIKPKTFHLTVLMLKLWNKDRVEAAAEVLRVNVSNYMAIVFLCNIFFLCNFSK